jgi:hypothetical protein
MDARGRKPIVQHLDHFIAHAKDFIGVLEGDPARLRENHFFVLALEQFHADGVFKLLELSAQRGLAKPELVGGSGDPAFRSNHLEIK